MNSKQVKEKIEKEIAGDWSITNAHGVDLKKCLVEPKKGIFENSFNKNKRIELWLVFEENPIERNGYKIIYDENMNSFGLATTSESRPPLFIGYYGSFLNTIEAM
jgi:hypothetical protein